MVADGSVSAQATALGTCLKRVDLGSNYTKFFPSRGTPAVLVVKESLVVEGETENLRMSPKLITCIC